MWRSPEEGVSRLEAVFRWDSPVEGCAVCFCQLSINYSQPGKEDVREIASIRWACRHVDGAFSWLIIDVGGPKPLCQAVMGYRRRQAELVLESKPVSSTPRWSASDLPPDFCLSFPQCSVTCKLK